MKGIVGGGIKMAKEKYMELTFHKYIHMWNNSQRISYSTLRKGIVLSHVQFFVTLQTVSCEASLPM